MKMWYVVFTQNLTMLYFLTCAHFSSHGLVCDKAAQPDDFRLG